MAAPDWLTARPIAHRGYHDSTSGRIENTISAVSAALDHRFSIELDLQLTGDEQVVAFHDYQLDRLTESTGRVDQLGLSALRATRLRDSHERIPTLDEVLEEVAGRVPLFLELKSSWTSDRRLERAVAAVLTNYAGPVAVMSFDPMAVREVRRLAPHLPRGLVAGLFKSLEEHSPPPHYVFAFRQLLPAGIALPHFIAYEVSALPATAPLMIRHVFNLPLLTWTVRTPAEREIAGRWADQMIFEGFDPDEIRRNA